MIRQIHQSSALDAIDLSHQHADQDDGQPDSELFFAAGQYTLARCKHGVTASRCKHGLSRCKTLRRCKH